MDASELPINSSYAYWPPNSTFRLVNVPWDSGYRNVVEFADRAAQDAWFDRLPGITVTRASMQRYGAPVRVDVPFNRASLYNYLVVEQPYDFDTTKRYCYFITDCTQVNATVTQLNVYLDVWQTYLFDRTWGQAYVERGHIGVANENQMAYHMRANLDIPEGLDCGSEYRIVKQVDQHYLAKTTHPGETHPDETHTMLVIVSTVNLSQDPGDVSNPHLFTANGSFVDTISNGANVYALSGRKEMFEFWGQMQSKSWASQGVLSMWLCPDITYQTPPPAGSSAWGLKFHLFGDSSNVELMEIGHLTRSREFIRADNLISMDNLALPARYRHLRKFLTYPYSVIELSTTNGSCITLKPQYFDGDTVVARSVEWLGAPSPRMWIMPEGYNGDEGYSMTVGFDDFPRLLGVTNASQTWLASNANSIRYQRSNAEWSQDKTLKGVNNAYAQASESASLAQTNAGRNRTLARTLNALQVDAANAQTENGNLANRLNANTSVSQQTAQAIVSGAGSIAPASGPVAAGVSLAGQAGSLAIGANAQYEHMAIQNNAATSATSINNALSTASMSASSENAYTQASDAASMQQRFADQNRALGVAVAHGDYANTIAGINARVQDAQLIPPSTVGTSGGEAALIALGDNKCRLRLRRINDAAIRNIGEVWLRYGYYVQRYMTLPAKLKCMSHFAYWKCQDVELVRGAMPEEFKLTLKGILEKGVTVWSDPDIIATCDRGDNAPLPGYRY